MAGLDALHSLELKAQLGNRIALGGFQFVELHVLDQDCQRIANATELLAVAADLVEHFLFDFRIAAMAEVDIDQPELAGRRAKGP